MFNVCHDDFVLLLLQLMLERWNSLIFENVREKLLAAAMEFLYSERSGEAFESQLVIGVRESFGELSILDLPQDRWAKRHTNSGLLFLHTPLPLSEHSVY